jgi:hypothetical protein
MNGQAEYDGPAGADELTRLEAHVRWRVCGHVRDLRLTVESNRLVLRGRTHSYYIKQLAQQAVMQFTQLHPLANEIEVLDHPAAEQA